MLIRNLISNSTYNKALYNKVSIEYLRRFKNSNTVVIIGSGPSMKLLDYDELAYIKKHDTIGLNYSMLLGLKTTFQIVSLSYNKDFYYLIDFASANSGSINIIRNSKLFSRYLKKNKGILTTEYQKKIKSEFNILNEIYISQQNKDIFSEQFSLYSKQKVPINIESSMILGGGSLIAGISLAYSLGYENIILAGMDLNTHDYFYNDEFYYDKLPQFVIDYINENKDLPYASTKSQEGSTLDIFTLIKIIKSYYSKRKVRIYLLNNLSKLSSVLDTVNKNV